MKGIINIKADKEVKKKAQKVAEELGFSLSAVINAYLKQFVRSKEVYFSLVPRMSPELEKLLGEIDSDIKREKNISQRFSSKLDLKNYFSSLRDL